MPPTVPCTPSAVPSTSSPRRILSSPIQTELAVSISFSKSEIESAWVWWFVSQYTGWYLFGQCCCGLKRWEAHEYVGDLFVAVVSWTNKRQWCRWWTSGITASCLNFNHKFPWKCSVRRHWLATCRFWASNSSLTSEQSLGRLVSQGQLLINNYAFAEKCAMWTETSCFCSPSITWTNLFHWDNRRGTFRQLLCSIECVAVNVPHGDLPHHIRPKPLLEDVCVGLSPSPLGLG